MVTRFDEKGKFFTDIVSKTSVAVILQTQLGQRIHGDIHVRSGYRLKDEINEGEQYIAITNATIYAPTGEILYRSKFVTINRDEVLWVIPEDELVDDFAEEGKA